MILFTDAAAFQVILSHNPEAPATRLTNVSICFSFSTTSRGSVEVERRPFSGAVVRLEVNCDFNESHVELYINYQQRLGRSPDDKIPQRCFRPRSGQPTCEGKGKGGALLRLARQDSLTSHNFFHLYSTSKHRKYVGLWINCNSAMFQGRGESSR